MKNFKKIYLYLLAAKMVLKETSKFEMLFLNKNQL